MGDVLALLEEDLIESLLSLLLSLKSLVLLADVSVLELVGEELGGVVVMGDELVITIDLVSESAFLNRARSTAPSLMSSTGVSQ
jgi:hypothetical protein